MQRIRTICFVSILSQKCIEGAKKSARIFVTLFIIRGKSLRKYFVYLLSLIYLLLIRIFFSHKTFVVSAELAMLLHIANVQLFEEKNALSSTGKSNV